EEVKSDEPAEVTVEQEKALNITMASLKVESDLANRFVYASMFRTRILL
ncbi:hypothetical protein Tco_0883443, partial [Tanacetum coccineum]